MIPYNYHTHTYRCGHAYGEDEEYVLEAIAAGVRVLGISDHVIFPNINQPGIRGRIEELDGYLYSFNCLREKYKERIRMLIGFEAEYSPSFIEYYKILFEDKKIDYLILGQHYEFNKGHISNYFGHAREKDTIMRYRDLVVEAMSTGLFKLVAHPDLYMASYPKFDSHAKKVAADICKASLLYDVPLEINLAGYRHGNVLLGNEKRYTYPYPDFWKIVGKFGCKVVIGVDAHNPKDFCSNEYSIALAMIRKYNLNHVKDFF